MANIKYADRVVLLIPTEVDSISSVVRLAHGHAVEGADNASCRFCAEVDAGRVDLFEKGYGPLRHVHGYVVANGLEISFGLGSENKFH